MYVLHYAPDNASLIIRMALEELALPYRTILVDRAARQQDSPAYRALNPAGLIPVLETPQGPLAETGAILLWLSETHGALGPRADDPARGAFLQQLFFVSNTLHADLRMVFYPEAYVGADCAMQAGLHETVTARLQRHYALLETQIESGVAWFGRDAPTILDLYIAATLRWAQIYGRVDCAWLSFDTYPCLRDMALRLEARSSVAVARLAEGLGTTPFTDPVACQPPEGSALG